MKTGRSERKTRQRRRLLWAGAAVLWVGLIAVVALRGPLRELAGGAGLGPDAGPRVELTELPVRVLSPDGTPVEGARVMASARPGLGLPVVVDGRTGAGGEARLAGVPVGEASLVVEAPGFAREDRAVTVEAGAAALEIRLEPGGAVAGTVVDEAGEPIANARVTALPEPSANLGPGPRLTNAPRGLPKWETTTGSDGGFGFDTLRPGPQLVAASAAGYDTTARVIETGADPVRLVLRQTGALLGEVSLADGSPAGGATVSIVGSGIWPARSVETDVEGSFRIDGVPPGVYEVRASRGTLVADPWEGLTIAAGGEARATLTLEPGTAFRGVVVRAEDATPIEGAEILLSEEALSFQPRAARTDEAGAFALEGLRPVPHRLSVRAEGFVPIVAEARTPDGEPVRIELRRAAILSGAVVDALGHAVAGAQVEIVGTDESGAAVGSGAADDPFRAALFAQQQEGPVPIASGELGVTLGEVPPIPLGSGPMVLPPAAATADPAAGEALGSITDAQGRFRLEGVPPGRLQLVARHPDHAPAITDPMLITAGEEREDLEIVVPDGGTIAGRVVDERGFPIGDVRVEMQAEREPWPRIAVSAEDGTFGFESVLGTTTLTAYPSGRPTARETVVVPSGETVEVALSIESELATLAARTVDERGFPIAGVRVHVRSLRARAPFSRAAVSADDGTLSIEGLPRPPWRITVQHEQYADTTRDVRSAEDELQLVLRGGAALRGRVVDDWDDAPVVGARVIVRGRRAWTAATNSEGAFEVLRLPEGNYEVSVTSPGFVEAASSAALSAGPRGLEDVELDPIRLVPGGAATGTVVDALGAPVSGAEVAWGSPPDWRAAARTDARGYFRLEGAPPGEVSLVARHPAAGESDAETARVFAREETPGITLHLRERFDPTRAELGEGRSSGVAVTLTERDDSLVIARVTPGSTAAEAGLRRGDVLLTIDGAEVTDLEEARARLRGAPGVEAILELERGGQTLRVPVDREVRY